MTYKQVLEQTGSRLFGEGLLDPPQKEEELDERRCFSKESGTAIDSLVLNAASAEIKGYYEPANLLHGTDPTNKWRTISCLQKAIRFGDVDMAMNAASAAYDQDPTYMVRRLGVIAAEDVGYGNIFALSVTMAMLGAKAWRQAVGERRLMLWLVKELASGWKDRSACDLMVLADQHVGMNKQALASMTDDELAFVASDATHARVERHIARWLLAGTKRFEGDSMPKDNARSPTRLFVEMRKSGMTRFGLWFAARICSRVGDAMFISVWEMDEWARSQHEPVLVTNVLPPTPKVGHLLAASYDQHTREGQAAIMKFFRETEAMHEFVEACPEASRRWLKMNGVFRAEGGLLNRQVFYGDAFKVHDACGNGALRYAGVLPGDLAESYLPTLQRHLPELHAAREKVLWASLKAKHAA